MRTTYCKGGMRYEAPNRRLGRRLRLVGLPCRPHSWLVWSVMPSSSGSNARRIGPRAMPTAAAPLTPAGERNRSECQEGRKAPRCWTPAGRAWPSPLLASSRPASHSCVLRTSRSPEDKMPNPRSHSRPRPRRARERCCQRDSDARHSHEADTRASAASRSRHARLLVRGQFSGVAAVALVLVSPSPNFAVVYGSFRELTGDD
jgi:hypothetical protein